MDVRALQRLLLAQGFDPGPIDGQIGKKTEAALKAWQAARRLLPDAVIGPRTRDALAAAGLTFSTLRVTTRCVDLIKAWEGIEDGNPRTVNLEPAPDPVGIWTLGWGHALQNQDGSWCRTKAQADAAMLRLFNALSITRDQAKVLLAADIEVRLPSLLALLDGVATTQDQLDALMSFVFNVGAGQKGFAGSTLRARHANGVRVSAQIDYGAAKAFSQNANPAGPTEHAFGAYSRSGGKWFLGLFRRRMCEAMIYRGDPVDVALAHAGALS
ncbi:glycoside hydrolase family protein [Brevundimonas subvibrioides]|uniref:Lysozyme n=1 Tax=Brevundimonas subvibrioides (strain ATCC 15264 / DSM 4735 / LMG 14903 / NBRC 16000 / CB 81) TaxID=633149 RepID=D9QHU3_BRESC|nr:peptidoglycan-binding protein [Brevundimonas subvibrioides]ADK99368.1 Peptidoglycan-binding domain 1 protein [Brevundimonas subvibrioides ATCC 15264]